MNIRVKDRHRLVELQKDIVNKIDKLTRSGDREHNDKKVQEAVRDYKEMNKEYGFYKNWEAESKLTSTDTFKMPKK